MKPAAPSACFALAFGLLLTSLASASQSSQFVQSPAVVAPIYDTVLRKIFEQSRPGTFDVTGQTINMWPVSRQIPDWWAEFADLPAPLLDGIDLDNQRAPVPSVLLVAGALPSGARLLSPAAAITPSADPAVHLVSLSQVLLAPGGTDALVYYAHSMRGGDHQDKAYAWLHRDGQAAPWQVAKVIVHENAWTSMPWTVLSARDIEVIDACFKKHRVYERVDGVTILSSYRTMGWGNMKDVVTIDVPPVLLKKLMNTRKVVQDGFMFVGTVEWQDARSAVLTIDGFSPQSRSCRAQKRRLWSGWAVEPPGIIE